MQNLYISISANRTRSIFHLASGTAIILELNSCLSRNGYKSSIGIDTILPSGITFEETLGIVSCIGSTNTSHITGLFPLNVFLIPDFKLVFLVIFMYFMSSALA